MATASAWFGVACVCVKKTVESERKMLQANCQLRPVWDILGVLRLGESLVDALSTLASAQGNDAVLKPLISSAQRSFEELVYAIRNHENIIATPSTDKVKQALIAILDAAERIWLLEDLTNPYKDGRASRTVRGGVSAVRSDNSLLANLHSSVRMLNDALNLEPLPSTKAQSRQLVLLVHGIRTQAEWQEMVIAELSRPGLTTVEPIKYEFFDGFRFWFPWWTRQRPINEVATRIRDAIDRHPNHVLVIIAHSFGTYAVLNILVDFPEIKPAQLIFCGSVVSRTYPWSKLKNMPRVFVNECGSRDIWPILAQSGSWGYGASGTFGFGGYGIRDRFHDLPHSGYFIPDFINTFWRPLVHEGHYAPSAFERSRPTAPYWRSAVTMLPLRWAVLALLIVPLMYWALLASSVIPAPTSLAGTVHDQVTLAPLRGVALSIQDLDTSAGDTPTCISDSAGRFRFTGLPRIEPRQVRVIARKAGYNDSISDPTLGTTSHAVMLSRNSTGSSE